MGKVNKNAHDWTVNSKPLLRDLEACREFMTGYSLQNLSWGMYCIEEIIYMVARRWILFFLGESNILRTCRASVWNIVFHHKKIKFISSSHWVIFFLLCIHFSFSHSQHKLYHQGFWYFAEKKAKFSGIFRGKFAEKSADLAGFSGAKSQNSLKNRPISRETSQNLQKNRPILRDFSGKKSNFEGFSGQILRRIGRFHGKFRGENSPRTQSVKNSRFRWIFWANFAKIDQFCVDMTSICLTFY